MARMRILKRNRHARAVTLFLYRVPEVSEERFRIPIEPLRLCDDSGEIRMPLSAEGQGVRDFLLGAEQRIMMEILGHDELGREVRVKTEVRR